MSPTVASPRLHKEKPLFYRVSRTSENRKQVNPSPPHHMKIDTDSAAFLETLMFAYPADDNGENPLDGKSIQDFTPEFVAAVKGFCDGFRELLHNRNVEIPESDRPFGGNVYFSLSGHGCGFWDSSETEHLQPLLEEYSGDKYRFENVGLVEDEETGKLDLAILPEMLPAARLAVFTPANP